MNDLPSDCTKLTLAFRLGWIPFSATAEPDVRLSPHPALGMGGGIPPASSSLQLDSRSFVVTG